MYESVGSCACGDWVLALAAATSTHTQHQQSPNIRFDNGLALATIISSPVSPRQLFMYATGWVLWCQRNNLYLCGFLPSYSAVSHQTSWTHHNVSKMPLNRPNRSPQSKYINAQNNTMFSHRNRKEHDWVNGYRMVLISVPVCCSAFWLCVAFFFAFSFKIHVVAIMYCFYLFSISHNFVIIFHKYSACCSNLLWQTIEMQWLHSHRCLCPQIIIKKL